jgi:hypothetical protein
MAIVAGARRFGVIAISKSRPHCESFLNAGFKMIAQAQSTCA